MVDLAEMPTVGPDDSLTDGLERLRESAPRRAAGPRGRPTCVGVLTRRSIAVALRARADLRGHDAVSASPTRPAPRSGGLLSVEEARAAVLAAVPGPTEAEVAYLSEALGRVLAEPVDQHDRAAALGQLGDGRLRDPGGRRRAARPRTRRSGSRSSARSRAGQAPDVEVRRGTAVRIATGAPVPPGADAVVPVELTTPLDADGSRRARAAATRPGPLPAACLVHEAVRVGGVDPAGRQRPGAGRHDPRGRAGRSAPQAVALAAGAGVPAADGPPPAARRRPRDRRRGRSPPVSDLGPAGIPDANGPGLAALVEDAGGEPQALGIAKDRLEDVESRLCAALAGGRRRDRRVGRRVGRAVRRRRSSRSRRSAGSTSGGSRSSPASRSRSGPPSGPTAGRRSCSACRATRSRAS